jgi:hypothetical protein
VCANYKTGELSVVNTGASLVVLDRRQQRKSLTTDSLSKAWRDNSCMVGLPEVNYVPLHFACWARVSIRLIASVWNHPLSSSTETAIWENQEPVTRWRLRIVFSACWLFPCYRWHWACIPCAAASNWGRTEDDTVSATAMGVESQSAFFAARCLRAAFFATEAARFTGGDCILLARRTSIVLRDRPRTRRAIFDPQVGTALSAIHDSVNTPWTVESPGRSGGHVSLRIRSVFRKILFAQSRQRSPAQAFDLHQYYVVHRFGFLPVAVNHRHMDALYLPQCKLKRAGSARLMPPGWGIYGQAADAAREENIHETCQDRPEKTTPAAATVEELTPRSDPPADHYTHKIIMNVFGNPQPNHEFVLKRLLMQSRFLQQQQRALSREIELRLNEEMRQAIALWDTIPGVGEKFRLPWWRKSAFAPSNCGRPTFSQMDRHVSRQSRERREAQIGQDTQRKSLVAWSADAGSLGGIPHRRQLRRLAKLGYIVTLAEVPVPPASQRAPTFIFERPTSGFLRVTLEETAETPRPLFVERDMFQVSGKCPIERRSIYVRERGHIFHGAAHRRSTSGRGRSCAAWTPHLRSIARAANAGRTRRPPIGFVEARRKNTEPTSTSERGITNILTITRFAPMKLYQFVAVSWQYSAPDITLFPAIWRAASQLLAWGVRLTRKPERISIESIDRVFVRMQCPLGAIDSPDQR